MASHFIWRKRQRGKSYEKTDVRGTSQSLITKLARPSYVLLKVFKINAKERSFWVFFLHVSFPFSNKKKTHCIICFRQREKIARQKIQISKKRENHRGKISEYKVCCRLNEKKKKNYSRLDEPRIKNKTKLNI